MSGRLEWNNIAVIVLGARCDGFGVSPLFLIWSELPKTWKRLLGMRKSKQYIEYT